MQGQGIVLVIIGLFVLVWIISAVVKATQSTPPNQRAAAANRQRQAAANRPVERTSNTDINRFMAEIDRLRNRGEGAPAGRPAEQPRVSSAPLDARPKTGPRREKERRPRAVLRTVSPPPLPSEPVPFLKPITAETQAGNSTPSVPSRPNRPARTASTAIAIQAKASPLLETLQAVLKGKQGPATALILGEIFSESPGKKALKRALSPS